MVGYNEYGTVSNSYATGAVSGVGGSFRTGGLVGANWGTISNSYATGAVTSSGFEVGGLVGGNGGPISNTYAIGAVTGNGTDVGGLVGHNYNSINNSYATGAVSGTNSVGGLVGYNEGTVSNSFWDSGTAGGVSYGIGYDAANDSMPTNIGATDMASFRMNEASLAEYGFDFETTWWMVDGNTRPFLQSEWSATITNAHQLQLMAMDLSASYALSNNIDMQPEQARGLAGMWNTATGFAPVGMNGDSPFAGKFDGLNHTISNLYINRPDESSVGLFGYTRQGQSRDTQCALVGR